MDSIQTTAICKSELLGLNIPEKELHTLASKVDCKFRVWPATYLGLPLGGDAQDHLLLGPDH